MKIETSNSSMKIENFFDKNLINYASNNGLEKIEIIKSGSIALNQALGIGGYPIGRIIEIFGNESSGKTTLALHAIREAQLINKKCLFIDIENSFDNQYAKAIGINLDKLLVAHPTHGEQVFDMIELLIKNNNVDVIVVDSVAAMVPMAELEAKNDEQQMGLHARMMSKGLRKIQSALINHECTIFFINQIREKIGVFFGNPETTTGGKSLKFYSSIRIETRKSDLIKDNNEKIGIQMKATIVKNKLSAPLKSAFIDIYFQNGFNYNNEIIEFAIVYEVIKKSGSWYYYNEQKIAQGKEQLKKYLLEHENEFNEIKNKVIEHVK